MGKALNNTIYYTIGAIAKASASFLLLPVFTNMLGTEQYGILSLLQTFSTILATIMTLAIERSLYRLFYDYHTEEEQNNFLSTVLCLICLNSIVVIVLLIILGHFVVRYIGDIDIYMVFYPVVIYTFLSAIINYSQIIMQVEQKGKQYLMISLLILVIYNVVALFLIFTYSSTIHSLVYASFVTYLLVTPIAYYKIRKRFRLKIDMQVVYAVFRYSLPMLLMIVFAWILNFSDRLFIGNLTNFRNVGIYSLAAKITSVITLFAGAVFQAYGPYFYHIANTMQENEAKTILKESNSMITLFVCFLGICIVLFSKTILSVLFSVEYLSALTFIYFLTISLMFTQQSGLLNVMIYQNKKTVGISFITIVAGVLSVSLNYWLIPIYGAVFAGVSNLIVGVFMIISTLWLARRNYYVEINIPLLFYGIALIILYIICDCMIENHWTDTLFKLFLFGLWVCFGQKINIVNFKTLCAMGGSVIRKFNSPKMKSH